MKTWKEVVLTGILTVLALVILGVGNFAFVCWNFDRWPFNLKKLDRLSDTTTMQEVQEILGEPNSVFIRTNQNGEAWQEWAYSAPGAWPIVYIYFDPDGTYSTNECDF